MLTDSSLVDRLLAFLASLPPELVYPAVGIGAAVENLFPPVPADTFVLFGAFLSAQGSATALGVFLVTWFSNTASALTVYALGRRLGPGFFRGGVGHWLLRPRQLEHLASLYESHGSKIIFASRFLPGFRALVPVFAGISRLTFIRTAVPLSLASGIWYGILVYVGAIFGRNWRAILEWLQDVNSILIIIATAVALLLGLLWWRTRHSQSSLQPGGSETAGDGG